MFRDGVSMPGAGFHILTKPVGPICNLDCKYCFYLEKEALYPQVSKWAMTDDVLEAYVRQYIEAQPADKVHFAWQGGEPTLLGVDFYRQVVQLQARYANGKTIENALQTNGTLLNDAWGEFLSGHRWWSEFPSMARARCMTPIAWIREASRPLTASYAG